MAGFSPGQGFWPRFGKEKPVQERIPGTAQEKPCSAWSSFGCCGRRGCCSMERGIIPECPTLVLSFNTHPSTGAKKRGLKRSLRVTHHTPGSCKQRGQHWMSPSIPRDPGTLQGQATLSRAPCSIPSWILHSWRHCCPQEIQPPEREAPGRC